MNKSILIVVLILAVLAIVYFVFLRGQQVAVQGQCNAQCDPVKVFGPPGARKASCTDIPKCTNAKRPDPNNTNSCGCHMYKLKKRDPNAEFEYIDSASVAYDSVNYTYRCYCTQLK